MTTDAPANERFAGPFQTDPPPPAPPGRPDCSGCPHSAGTAAVQILRDHSHNLIDHPKTVSIASTDSAEEAELFCRPAAIHGERLARDERRLVRTEPQHCFGDFLGQACAQSGAWT